MRRLLLLTIVLVVFIGGFGTVSHAQERTDRVTYFGAAMRPEFHDDIALFPDAPLYIIDAALTIADIEATINGTLDVHYTNRSADTLDAVVFRLYPNLNTYGGLMFVSSIAIDGAVGPEVDTLSSVLDIPLATPLEPGETVQISMEFSTTVYVDVLELYAQFSYLNGALALPNWFPLLSVYEDGTWWRNTDHPQGDAVYSETAFFDVTLTTPSDLVIITSGSQIDTQFNSDNTRTNHYIAPLMRDFAVMAAPGYETLTEVLDEIAVDVHYLPEGEAGAEQVTVFALDAMQIFDETFGPYPYAEIDIVETFTVAGGIEYPGLVVIQDDSWVAVDNFLEFVVVHEVAHQWWYSVIGNDQTRYPWLDEALAQYSTLFYYGQVHGTEMQAALADSFEANWQNLGDMPIGGPVIDYPDNAYFYIIYQKGPMFFVELAERFCEEALHTALNDYYMAYRYQIATPDDLQASLEQSLRQDLDALFSEWVN